MTPADDPGADSERAARAAAKAAAQGEVTAILDAYDAGEVPGGRGEVLWRLGRVAYPRHSDYPFAALDDDRLSDDEYTVVMELAQDQPVVDPRSHVIGLHRGEIELARRAGREPDRRVLERRVRACAVFACDEDDFVERLAADGIELKPHIDPRDNSTVVGYMVALPAEETNPTPRWYSGGKLARDLTLPKLRRVWSERWT